ncbi:MAG: TIGR03862 family flavoprotein [Herbaspirillum sp.]
MSDSHSDLPAVSTIAHVAVIGGGPAGLMAAETLSSAGVTVDLYDAMPSVGRKFLLAGKGGLNLTHAEPSPQFASRYHATMGNVSGWLEQFDAQALRDWAQQLGIPTFVGSSGRVFPTEMKAAPLLRAWLQRLRAAGVRFHMRSRWLGWREVDGVRLHQLQTVDGLREIQADAVVLALGGGSWARLGSDGAWWSILEQRGVKLAPLRATNCGFETNWSDYFQQHFAGQPLKSITASLIDVDGHHHARHGELMITQYGVEGSLIYGWSRQLRAAIDVDGSALLTLDLAPAHSLEHVRTELERPRGARSLSSHLQSRLNLRGVKVGLLRELVERADFADPLRLATAIKALPLRLHATRPLDEAISSAGGVCFDALDAGLMLRSHAGVFCAGEMLDWEAPTGGYLLTGCFASGRVAAHGVLMWLGVNVTNTTS